MVRSPLIWFGGKSKLASKLISLMPPHKTYVEVFGGAAHVLASKPLVSTEVYNDIDGDLVNFLLVLRDKRVELQHACSTLPYSRELFERWKGEELPKNNFERAVRWFYLNRSGIAKGNTQKTGWRHGREVNTARAYRHACDDLQNFARRMDHVMIECSDFAYILDAYDTDLTLFYLDPPYVGNEKQYQGGFDEIRHRELARTLQSIKGYAMVSYYPHPLVDELYPGWYRTTLDSVKTGRAGAGEKERSLELVLTNYEPAWQTTMFAEVDS